MLYFPLPPQARRLHPESPMTNETLSDLQADCDAAIVRVNRVTAVATARARVVRAEIDRLRKLLRSSRRSNPNARLLLASYDAELERLCTIYDVTRALYGDDALTPNI